MRNKNNFKRLTLWTFVLGVMLSLVLIGPLMSALSFVSTSEKMNHVVDDANSGSNDKSISTSQARTYSPIFSDQQNDDTRSPSTTKFGNITITTNASRYFPGETMSVNILGPIDELNGTMEWKLFTPLNESIFGFDLLRFLLLENFDFETTDTSEWTNDAVNSFDSITVSNGYLNLTEAADADTNPARAYVNKTNVNLTALTVSFDYLGLTPNLIKNASFEGTGGWLFNTSLVKQSSDLVHSGNFALFANKTPSNTVIASQNVTAPEKTTLIISAWGTGINSTSQWLFRITAFNATGDVVGSPKNSSLSSTLTADELENGFGMIETTFETPINTSFVQIELIGINSTANGTYTGYFDDVTISIAPPSALEFQYYNGTNWVNLTGFQTTTHKWNRFQATIRLNSTTSPANGTIFALVLPDESTNPNDPTVSWLLDNFTFVKITPPIGRLSAATEVVRGSVNATRIFHVDNQVKNETLVSFYEYLFTEIEGKPTVSVNITLTLPREQVYYGPHALDVIFYPNITGQEVVTSPVVLSHLVYIVDEFRFEPLKYYALRGSVDFTYNDTQTNQNITIQQVFYEEEPEKLFSPGDNVTIIGFIIPKSPEKLFNKTTALDTSFYQLKDGYAKFDWQGVTENITWGTNGDSILRIFSPTAKDIAHGNFSVAFPQLSNYTKFVAMNFVIPSRGIFGSVNSTLFFDFKTTLSPNGHGFNKSVTITPYTVNISMPELEVKFRLNVTQSLVPSTSRFVPLQSIDGTFTINPLHVRDDLLDRYQTANITLNNGTVITVNRTIYENITSFVPLSDLHFRMFLDATGKGNESTYDETIDILIPIDRIGDKFSWFYKFSPNDLNGTYVARISWLEAEKVNDSVLEFVAFNKKGPNPTELPINLDYELQFTPFSTIPIAVTQGDVLVINFTFIIQELGEQFYIPGIKLNARLDNNDSFELPVAENNGIYLITLATRSLTVGSHIIELYHQSSGAKLATIQLTINPNPSLTRPSDRFTPLSAEDPVTTLLSTIIVGVASIIAIGLVAIIPRYLASRRR